jgi:hypothetical protein
MAETTPLMTIDEVASVSAGAKIDRITPRQRGDAAE